MSVAENPARQFIDTEFPVHFRPLIGPALRRAYGAVDALMERVEFLATPSGKFQRGDLLVKATEYEFVRMIEAGSLPFDPAWEQYASPTGKHLVMRTRRARITINQVETMTTKPRKAVFRENFGLSNTKYLFDEWNDEAQSEEERRHLVLLHGYQKLTFANLAMPDPTKSRLIEWTDNLLKIAHEVPDQETEIKAEGPAESPDPEAIEDMIKFISDNG